MRPQLTAAGVDIAVIDPVSTCPEAEVAVSVHVPSTSAAPVTSPDAEIVRPSTSVLTIVTDASCTEEGVGSGRSSVGSGADETEADGVGVEVTGASTLVVGEAVTAEPGGVAHALSVMTAAAQISAAPMARVGEAVRPSIGVDRPER